MGAGRVVAGELPAVVHSGVERAIGIQQSAVSKYVQRLRRSRPDATPAQLVSALERRYLTAVTGVGAAVGVAAAVPGAGTGLALALSAGETAVFAETTTMFTLAVAEVHAIRADPLERGQTPLLTVALSDGGDMLVRKVAGDGSEHRGKLLTDLIPMASISAINKTLWHWFVTRYPRQPGPMAIGKIAPFGIGAGLAAVGNLAFGRMVVSASRRVFGAPPASFDSAITIVDSPARPPGTTLAPAPRPEPPVTHDELPGPGQQFAPGAPDVPVTGKYRPLFDHLSALGADHVEIPFSDIDALVPGGLPKSASTRTWWGNSPGSRQAKAWLAAGYETADVDVGHRTVRFEQRRGHCG